MLPLGKILQKYYILIHCYVDDTKLHPPLRPDDDDTLWNRKNPPADIHCWMAQNVL